MCDGLLSVIDEPLHKLNGEHFLLYDGSFQHVDLTL